MTTEWQEHGGAVSGSSQKVEYAWSEMPSGANHSRLVSITYPDGYVLTFNYSLGLNNDVSRLSSLSDTTGTLEEYDYLGSGTVVRRAHPQPAVDMTLIGAPGVGGDQYAGLDEFGRVVDLLWVETSGPTTLEHIQHSYDLLGNRLTRDNLVNSAFDEVYAYDDLSQLVNFARGAHTQDWDYDALGNWNSVTTDGGTPETRSHNAQNQITGISGATTPAFDANGNMTGDEVGRTFVYDAWHRLVEVKNGSTVLKTYRYDGLNRRVSADDGTDVTDLYYSDQWQVLEERVNGNVYAHYVWSPVYVDAMVLRDRSVGGGTLNERLYVIQDANFNIVALVAVNGTVAERYAYTPFGVRTVMDPSWNVIGSSAYAFEHGFQGRPFDAISGTNNFRNRDYSPTLGRWISIDPLRYETGDFNLYRALGNRPINTVDPSGLDFFDWLANRVIGTENVRSWDNVFGDLRTGWFAQTSNFAAGWGDTLSFGLTSSARHRIGYDDVVDYGSGAYFGGQIVGTVHGLVMMRAGPGVNISRQGWSRAFWDGRTWGSVRRVWSGMPPTLRANGLALHHVIIPQRWTWIPQGIRNAGFNYMPMSAWRNSVLLNRYAPVRPFEWAYRFGYFTQLNPLVNPILGRYPGSHYSE